MQRVIKLSGGPHRGPCVWGSALGKAGPGSMAFLSGTKYGPPKPHVTDAAVYAALFRHQYKNYDRGYLLERSGYRGMK